jgi:hypothetical protein
MERQRYWYAEQYDQQRAGIYANCRQQLYIHSGCNQRLWMYQHSDYYDLCNGYQGDELE